MLTITKINDSSVEKKGLANDERLIKIFEKLLNGWFTLIVIIGIPYLISIFLRWSNL